MTVGAVIHASHVSHTVQRNKTDSQPMKYVQAITRGRVATRPALKHNQAWPAGWDSHTIRHDQLEHASIGPILAAIEDKNPRLKWSEVSAGSTGLKTL